MDVHKEEDLLGISDHFDLKALNGGPRQPVGPVHPGSSHSPVLHELQVSPEIFQGFTKSFTIGRPCLNPSDQSVCMSCALASSMAGRATS